MSAGTCGPDGCGDCRLACAGGGPDPSGAGEDLTVVVASGLVIAVLAGVLSLRTVAWVSTLGGLTAGAGVTLAGAALVARTSRRAGLGDALAGTPARLLPFVTGALLVTVLARVATSLA